MQTIGGNPIECYTHEYTLSGKLDNKNVELKASLRYSRGCREIDEVESCIIIGGKSIIRKFEPTGEFMKKAYREDEENLWFLTEKKVV